MQQYATRPSIDDDAVSGPAERRREQVARPKRGRSWQEPNGPNDLLRFEISNGFADRQYLVVGGSRPRIASGGPEPQIARVRQLGGGVARLGETPDALEIFVGAAFRLVDRARIAAG